MSSSRSDDVTKSVCLSVSSHSFSFDHLKHLKQDVSRVLQVFLLDVPRLFQGCFKEVSRVFQGSFKGVSRKFQGRFKEDSRKF